MSYEKVKQAERLSIGFKQALKAIEHERVKELFIARDADKHIQEKVLRYSKEKNIPITFVDSKKQLGKACGIDVSASTVAILK